MPTSPITGVLVPWGPDRPSEGYDLATTARVCTGVGTSVTVTMSGNEAAGVVFLLGTESDDPNDTVVSAPPAPVAVGGGTVSLESTTNCWWVILGYAAFFEQHTASIIYSVAW